MHGLTLWTLGAIRSVEGEPEPGAPLTSLMFVSLFVVLGAATTAQLLLAVRLVEVRAKPDTLTQAARWIDQRRSGEARPRDARPRRARSRRPRRRRRRG
jgi:hypothetical protein